MKHFKTQFNSLKKLAFLSFFLVAQQTFADQIVLQPPSLQNTAFGQLSVSVSQRYLEKIKNNINANPLDRVGLQKCTDTGCSSVTQDLTGLSVNTINPSVVAAWCKETNCNTQNGYSKTLRLEAGAYKIYWNGTEKSFQLNAGQSVALPVTEVYIVPTPGRFVRAEAYSDLVSNPDVVKAQVDAVLSAMAPKLPEVISLKPLKFPLANLTALSNESASLFVRSLCRQAMALDAYYAPIQKVCQQATSTGVMSKSKLIESFQALAQISGPRVTLPAFERISISEVNSISGLKLLTTIDSIVIFEPTSSLKELNTVIPAFENNPRLRTIAISCYVDFNPYLNAAHCTPARLIKKDYLPSSTWSIYGEQVVTTLPGRYHVKYISENQTDNFVVVDISNQDKQIELNLN